jgi:sodium-dependent dicarboxylate transporter 2/3/5
MAIAMGWPLPARAGIIAGFCLTLWLSEWVPVWVPTLVLWVSVPIVFADAGPSYRPQAVLQWSADPVIVLFLSGFALAAAARRWKLDAWLVAHAVQLSRGQPARLTIIAAFTTAALSMWMSNVAAAALMFGAVGPIVHSAETSSGFRRALLLVIALAADVGGVATPIGSGPNGIAMAAAEATHRIEFIEWMAFGVPLALGLVTAVVAMVLLRFPPAERFEPMLRPITSLGPRAWMFLALLSLTIGFWLTEPVHGWSAATVAAAAIGVLVLSGLLGPRDLKHIDWATLLLIAGGIALGTLLDRSGAVHSMAASLPLGPVPHFVTVLGLCLLCAILSALMSNTAAATLLIPLAATIDPSPSTAVLVAVSASLGVPFVISTPPNAMAVASGLRSSDLLLPGLLLMVGGCLVIALTGPWVLAAVGIP